MYVGCGCYAVKLFGHNLKVSSGAIRQRLQEMEVRCQQDSWI